MEEGLEKNSSEILGKLLENFENDQNIRFVLFYFLNLKQQHQQTSNNHIASLI